MDIYMKRVTLTPNRPNSSYPDPLFGGMPGLELSRNIFIDSAGSWGQLAPQSVQCQRRWTPPGGINSTTWDFSLRPCLTQKPLVMIWGCKDQIWRSDLAYVCQQQLWGKISQPDGFAELIFECRPVCWSTVYLEKPLGPGKKVPWVLASPCTPASDRGAIQLLKCQYYLKCLWVSPWCSFSSPGRQGTPMGPMHWSPLQSLKQHQMLYRRLLREALRPVDKELCVGVRASWGVEAALNQPILCNCQLNAFMSRPGLLLKHGYTGNF